MFFKIDERKTISKTAFKIIKEHIDSYSDIEIYNIYRETGLFHVKYFSLLLLTNYSKWKSLKYILKMLPDGEYIYHICKEYLKYWIYNFNRSSIVPAEEDINQIKFLLINNQKYLSKDEFDFIKFTIGSYLNE